MSQKQPGGQTESSLEGKVGPSLSGPAGVVCRTAPVRGGLVSPLVVLSSLLLLLNLQISLRARHFPPSPKYRQLTRHGFLLQRTAIIIVV